MAFLTCRTFWVSSTIARRPRSQGRGSWTEPSSQSTIPRRGICRRGLPASQTSRSSKPPSSLTPLPCSLLWRPGRNRPTPTGVPVPRTHPDFYMRRPGLLRVVGVVLSMALVWWLILRREEEGRPRLERILERIPSRDYVYLIVTLPALHRLEWFVWAAAIGANLFWPIVWWASGRVRAA